MTVYKVVSKNGQSYTIGTDNILGAARSIKGINAFQPKDVVKIVEVEERFYEYIEVEMPEKQERINEYESDITRMTEAIEVLKEARGKLWKERDALFLS